jgi:hypothetical protein
MPSNEPEHRAIDRAGEDVVRPSAAFDNGEGYAGPMKSRLPISTPLVRRMLYAVVM